MDVTALKRGKSGKFISVPQFKKRKLYGKQLDGLRLQPKVAEKAFKIPAGILRQEILYKLINLTLDKTK